MFHFHFSNRSLLPFSGARYPPKVQLVKGKKNRCWTPVSKQKKPAWQNQAVRLHDTLSTKIKNHFVKASVTAEPKLRPGVASGVHCLQKNTLQGLSNPPILCRVCGLQRHSSRGQRCKMAVNGVLAPTLQGWCCLFDTLSAISHIKRRSMWLPLLDTLSVL